jgi:hypothetical protein
LNDLTVSAEVLRPVLNKRFGAQEAKPAPEAQRDMPPLYAEIADLADLTEHSLQLLEDTLRRVEL